MIDAHLHLDQYPLDQLNELIEEWQEAGIENVVAVSTNYVSACQTLTLKQKYPQFIYAAIGYHPEQALPDQSECDQLLKLIQQEKEWISAVGEVGTPYYTLADQDEPIEKYVELLQLFLNAAHGQGLPVLLHAVHDQAGLVHNLLQKQQIKKAHFHWLKAPASVVAQIVRSGYYISVTPEVCYRQRDQDLVRQVPVEQLLIETDGPWPYSEQFEGRDTSPLFLKEVVNTVAEMKQLARTTLIEQIRRNTQQLFTNNYKHK